jgi:hypothetical protein
MSRRHRTGAVATAVAAVALILGVPGVSQAQVKGVEIAFADGRVSLFVDKASAADVLTQWSLTGKTEVFGAELVKERVVSGLKLEDVAEGEALEAFLGKSFGFVEMAKSPERGLSAIRRIVIGTVLPPDMKPVDSSVAPELRYDYLVPDKAASAPDYGKPEYVVLKELPTAPEILNVYFTPEKSYNDYGKPVFEKFDPKWTIPELRFEFFLKDFPKFDVDPNNVRPPTTYPEVRFKYFCGVKAAPCW